MVRIDLGCGTNKQNGFIGVDRYPLPGVDAIADMNEPLPFRDDSVDLLVASHSLEHVNNLLATMKEVYRICKHGAQLCLIAPYSEQKLNLANPYHTCVFNEHTPRFWTPYPSAPVDPEEFFHPHAAQWGLSMSDNSDPGIDIRLFRMEHFYFPQYAGLPASEQKRLRQERVDVCDQILYHLLVWKGAEQSPAKSFEDYAAELTPYEPEYIQLRRNRGREMLLQKKTVELEEAHAAVSRLEGELQSRAVDAASAASQSRRVEELTADLERHRTLMQELRLDHHQQRSSLTTALEESLDLRNQLLDAKASLVTAKGELAQLTEARVKAIQDRDQAIAKEAILANEMAALRQAHAGERAAEAQVSARVRQELAEAKDEVRELRAATDENRKLRDEAARSGRELAFAQEALQREAAAAAVSQKEASSLMQQIRDLHASLESNEVLRAKLGLTQAELETTAALLGLERQKEGSLSAEVAAARIKTAAAGEEAERWKTLLAAAKRSLGALCAEARIPSPAHLVRAGGFVVGREGPPQGLLKRLVPLREYCDRHFRAARASVVLGGDLSEVPYREYAIPFELDRLTSVSLAMRPLLPGSSGIAGVEIVSAESEILAQTHLPLTDINSEEITAFHLPVPLTGLKKGWLLRIFVRDAGGPVPIYELARGALLRDAAEFFPFVLFQ